MAFLDETGLAELWKLIQAKDDALAAADVKIATGSYTGTGTYGSSNPTSLTFDFVPKFVFVTPNRYGGQYVSYMLWTHGVATIERDAKNTCYITINEKKLSWYASSSSPNTFPTYASYQFNESGTAYHWVAIG